jgi:L-arabinose isomerase
MNIQPRIGILPLYLALYDQVCPEYGPAMRAFAQQVAERLSRAGMSVELAPVSRVRDEIERSVAGLMARNVDLLATLHLAYSPSLEAVDALARVDAPLVLLDTTPAPRFSEEATMDDMFSNHGIHGVQDLACMLTRRKRPFFIVAGHVEDAKFVEGVAQIARAAQAAAHLRSSRVLVFGEEFPGMGDFAVTFDALRDMLGVSVRRIPVSELAQRVRDVPPQLLSAEAASDANSFDLSSVAPETLDHSNRVGLAIRMMLEEERASAFSFNFQSFDRAAGVPTVPFLEASKAMARGVGYAGEGDVLTAALVGALLRAFGDVTFTEMFCPDWRGNAVFMSHMGECNLSLAAERPRLVEKAYPFGDVENPIVALFPLRHGPATLVNIAPGPDDTFHLIAARVNLLERGLQPGFPDVPHFWISPGSAMLPDFLRRYSEAGGTHHLALVLGEHTAAIEAMATILGIRYQQV